MRGLDPHKTREKNQSTHKFHHRKTWQGGGHHLPAKMRAFTRKSIYKHLDHDLPSLKIASKDISIIYSTHSMIICYNNSTQPKITYEKASK